MAPSDCLIIGGGVIGLSLAWELAQAGMRVRVIDRGQPGQEASWAGAGMIPPGARRRQDSPLEQLQGLGSELHPIWHEKLRAATGMDNGFRRSGAIYLAESSLLETPNAGPLVAEANSGQAAARFAREMAQLRARGIRMEALSTESLANVEPALPNTWANAPIDHPGAWFLPDECQIRNPRHLRALLVACASAGVRISPGVEAEDFAFSTNGGAAGRRVTGVVAGGKTIAAGHVCLTAGCWSAGIARRLGVLLRVRPVRGQMALLRDSACLLRRIVNVGPRYLVPRGDGLVLVGSTEEEAGFDRSTTAAGIQGLLDFATTLAPTLANAALEHVWAGLRPASAGGAPYLGMIPQWENVSLATGHFRAGLWLSPATAVVMRQAILGQPTEVELDAFSADQH